MLYWIGILIVFLLALLVFRYFVRRDYRKQGYLSPFSTFLEFLIFGVHANLPYLYLSVPWPGLPAPPTNSFQLFLGLAFIILGLLATLFIMAHLGFKTTVGNPPGQLRQTGPYRWSRNPQILTYGLMILGYVILYPSLEAGAWFVLYGGIAQGMILTEEEHLVSLFGEKYQEYCGRVPRYLVKLPREGILKGISKE